MSESEGCIFCKIVRREAPASIVREDEATLAFMDIRPVNPGHVLVIPKDHGELLQDLAKGTSGSVLEAAREVATALRKSSLPCDAVSLYVADGEEAGQEVRHVHLHVIPRYRGDGFGLRFGPRYGEMPLRGDLDRIAGELRSGLSGSRRR